MKCYKEMFRKIYFDFRKYKTVFENFSFPNRLFLESDYNIDETEKQYIK